MNRPTEIPSFLVVDDYTPTRYALRLALKRSGASVCTATSAEQALGAIAAGRPIAIFADRVLPGMNGLELMQLLQRDPETRDIPFVICCPDDSWPLAELAGELGVLAILRRDRMATALPELLQRLRQTERSRVGGEAQAARFAAQAPRDGSRDEPRPRLGTASSDATRRPSQAIDGATGRAAESAELLPVAARRPPSAARASGVRRDAKLMAIGAACACVGLFLLSLF